MVRVSSLYKWKRLDDVNVIDGYHAWKFVVVIRFCDIELNI